MCSNCKQSLVGDSLFFSYLGSHCSDFAGVSAGSMRPHLGSAHQISLHCGDHLASAVGHGVFEAFQQMEVLTLSWPCHYNEHYPLLKDPIGGRCQAEDVSLTRCMPASG